MNWYGLKSPSCAILGWPRNARSSTSPSSRDGARMSSFDLDMDDMVSAQSMKSDRSGRSGRLDMAGPFLNMEDQCS